ETSPRPYVRGAPTGSNGISRTAQRHFPVRTGGLITFLATLSIASSPLALLYGIAGWGDVIAAINLTSGRSPLQDSNQIPPGLKRSREPILAHALQLDDERDLLANQPVGRGRRLFVCLGQ